VEKCYSSSGGSSYTKPTVVINTTNTTPVITPTKVVPTPTPVIKDPTPIKEEPVVIVEEEIEVEGKYIRQSGGRGQYGHAVIVGRPSERGAGF